MTQLIFCRFYRWLLLIALFVPQLATAQEHINLIMLYQRTESFNCSTGEITITFRISNFDEMGNSGMYYTLYSVDLGASSMSGMALPSGEDDVSFTGVYHAGDQITITAWGTYNNTAPQKTLTFMPNVSNGTPPPAPVISSNTSSLCGAESAILTATSTAGGTIYWNTGQSGNSIIVTTAGSYYAYESNGCGVSGTSNVINFATESIPSALFIASATGTTLCDGAIATLFVTSGGGGTVTWNTGATGNSITVTSPGSYYAYESNGCGNGANSNIISISTGQTPPAPTISSSNGTILCDGRSTVLSTSPSAGGTITWSTGQTGNSISVTTAGTYYAYETNVCASSASSNAIVITTSSTPTAPIVSPAGSQLLCNGESISLNSSGANVVWSNGTTGNTLTTSTAGTYFSIDRNACGYSANSNSIVLTTVVCPTPIPGSSFQVCPGALKTLDAGAGYDTYLWSNGATTRTISVGPGVYTVTVTKEGCSAVSAPVTVGYYVVVPPTITASGPLNFCAGESVALTSSNGSAYLWNTGATSSAISASTSGVYYVTVTDNNGCQATSAATTIQVNALPNATITGSTTVCKNSTYPMVTFAASGGAAPYTFVYQVNGGSTQSTTTIIGNSVSVTVPTGTAGTYTYSLVSVRESSSTACTNAANGNATVVVSELPTATITGETTICRNAVSPLITFTGNGGNAPYIFTFRINGGAPQTIRTTSLNSVTLGAPTSAAGTFVYELISVQDGSANACSATASGNVAIRVNPLPVATISGNITVCQNAYAPQITFTGGSGTAPYTFTYQINNGSPHTVTTVSGNSVSIAAPTTQAGVYTYSLVSVQDASIAACSNIAGGNAVVTVHALPAKAVIVTPNAHLCNGDIGQITVYNFVSGQSYLWSKDGVPLKTSVLDTIHITLEGSYSAVAVSDKGCASASSSDPVIITTGNVETPIITGVAKVCKDGKTLLTVTSKGNKQSGVVWRWTDTPSKRVVGEDSIFSALAGQYQVRVEHEGCYDSTLVTVTTDDTEFPAGVLKVAPLSIEYGNEVRFHADVTGAAYYRWDLGNGKTIETTTDHLSEYYYTSSDSIPIQVTAFSVRNCKTLFTAHFKVAPRPSPVLPDLSYAGVLKDWNVFPIPFQNQLKVSVVLKRSETVRLDLFTTDGKWIRSWRLAGRQGENLFTLNGLESLPANMVYFITGFYNGVQHSDKVYKY